MKGNGKINVVGPPPPGDEELRLWLVAYIEKHSHHTTAVLSRSEYIGQSRTALDGYLAGTYFLPTESGGQGVRPENSKLEKRIRDFRERVEGTVRHGYESRFVETRSWSQLQHACNTAIDESAIVVVYGKPGVGKSRCLREFAINKMTTQPLTILCSANITARYFVQKLARAVGLDDKPPTAKLEDSIAEKLKRSPRPIFVDQSNYLSEKSLGTICYLWELARIPVVLAGTKDLYDLFITSRLTEDVRAQLSSRVAMHYPLSELGVDEAKALLRRALGADATDEHIAQILKVTGGIFRHVDMFLPRFLELRKRNHTRLETGAITMEAIINTAGSRLMTA